jgi:uncharacterized protein YjhX (UPF0386 family)
MHNDTCPGDTVITDSCLIQQSWSHSETIIILFMKNMHKVLVSLQVTFGYRCTISGFQRGVNDICPRFGF